MPWWDKRAVAAAAAVVHQITAQPRPLSHVSEATGRRASPLLVWTTARHRTHVWSLQMCACILILTDRSRNYSLISVCVCVFDFRCGGGGGIWPQPAQWPSVALRETQAGSHICIIRGERGCSSYFHYQLVGELFIRSQQMKPSKTKRNSGFFFSSYQLTYKHRNTGL